MTTIFFGAMLLAVAPSAEPTAQLATITQEPLDGQALLPNAAVFFLPKSSALSPLAMDVVAQGAHKAGPGTIVIIRANYDWAAGETTESGLLRDSAVREELIRRGVPSSAIRTLISAATGTGIEARCVVVSVVPAKESAPSRATS